MKVFTQEPSYRTCNLTVCKRSESARYKDGRFAVLSVILLLCLTFFSQSTVAQALIQPDCPTLVAWSKKYDGTKKHIFANKVIVNALLTDEQVVPLFGRSILSWNNQEMGEVRNWLGTCRKVAIKVRDQAEAKQLYQALRAVADARTALVRLAQMREYAENKVQSLINHQPVPEMLPLLKLAQDALHGKDVTAEVREIKLRGTATRDVIDLQRAPDFLPTDEIAPLVERLDAHRSTIEGDLLTVQHEMDAARQELSQLPLTQEGLTGLDRLGKLPVLEKLSPDDQREFQMALQSKRIGITRAIQTQQAADSAARRAAAPAATGQPSVAMAPQSPQRRIMPPRQAQQPQPEVSVEDVLQALLNGDQVEEVSIRGIRPGANHGQAVRQVQKQWGFKETIGLSRLIQYADNNSIVGFEQMDDNVGQIEFTRYFKRMIFHKSVEKLLTDRYGEPDDIKSSSYSRLLTWKDGAQRLQALLSNQMEPYEAQAGFHSKVILALWNDDYEGFLVEKNERCDEIRNIPRNEMSMQQSVWFGTNCPWVSGQHEKAGL